MPIQPTYPGVYIEEIPSGVRTITGVATSITAFIGRALSGPVDEPIIINSFPDYERQFGGLWIESTMSYAVRDFYLNGGSQAIIIRITHDDAATASITLDTTDDASEPPLVLLAKNPGTWGDSISVLVNHDTKDPTNSSAAADDSIFNLLIFVNGVQAEEHLKVSMDENAIRYLPRVLSQSSALLVVQNDPTPPDIRPLATLADGDGDGNPDPVIATGGNDGDILIANDYLGLNPPPDIGESNFSGLNALRKADLFNLLCIPPPQRNTDTDTTVYQAALTICEEERAMLIVDPPLAWGASSSGAVKNANDGLGTIGLSGTAARNAVLYFPRVKKADPLRDNQTDIFVPCGIMAGVMSKTDTNRGVWKSPAGIDAGLNGIQGLQVDLTNAENGQLNPLGINCLRNFPVIGRVAWGARTLRGADVLADEYKYLAVRRTALFIEESLFRGTHWVVFEPNDEPLWAQIRLNVGAFMHNLFRQGAFQGSTPREAYLVKCDKETTTQNDINLGVVNILVGFAPLKPAEFVIIKLQQLAGQVDA